MHTSKTLESLLMINFEVKHIFANSFEDFVKFSIFYVWCQVLPTPHNRKTEKPIVGEIVTGVVEQNS